MSTFVKQISLLVAFLFITLEHLSGQDVPQMHLIAVGLDKYEQDLPLLDKCGKDARDLSAQLQKISGLYTPGVYSVLENAGATKSRILNAIESLKGKNPKDVVVFYFAGYGTDYAIFPFDARPSSLDNNNILSVATLKEKLESLGCRYLLFINNNKSTVQVASDASPSTAITTDGILSVVSKKEALSVRYLNPTDELFACSECSNSFFMQALLAAFENQEVSEQSSFSNYRADDDGNKIVSVAELAAFIPKFVRTLRNNALKGLGGIQAPEPKMYLNKNISLDLFTTNLSKSLITADQDSDGDGLADRLDQCPRDWAKTASGCPDADEDGVPDKDDQCKYEKGDAANRGCPDLSKKDQDNDGVPDMADKCPDQKGLTRFQGCPDTDNDGIPDNDDRCPMQKGVAAYFGCSKMPEKLENQPINKENWYLHSDGKYTKSPAFFFGLAAGQGGFGPILGCNNLREFLGVYMKFRFIDPNEGNNSISSGLMLTVKRWKKAQGNIFLGFNFNTYVDSNRRYKPGIDIGFNLEIKGISVGLGVNHLTEVWSGYDFFGKFFSYTDTLVYPNVYVAYCFRKR